jgi:hypothetical protein
MQADWGDVNVYSLETMDYKSKGNYQTKTQQHAKATDSIILREYLMLNKKSTKRKAAFCNQLCGGRGSVHIIRSASSSMNQFLSGL